MVDATIGYEVLSFMDESSDYNQICMAPKDEKLTVFRTPKGIYCYKIIPFDFKNAVTIYDKNVECYVDDLIVKSKKRSNYLEDLRQFFDQLRVYQLKMNILKFVFGVTSGSFSIL